jgi:hypothetical protein
MEIGSKMNQRGPRIICRVAAVLLVLAGLIPAAIHFHPWRKTGGISMMELMYGEVYDVKAVIAALICVVLGYVAFRIAGDARRDAVPFVLLALTLGAITIFFMMPPVYVSPAERGLGEPYPMQVFTATSNELMPPKILLPGSTN